VGEGKGGAHNFFFREGGRSGGGPPCLHEKERKNGSNTLRRGRKKEEYRGKKKGDARSSIVRIQKGGGLDEKSKLLCCAGEGKKKGGEGEFVQDGLYKNGKGRRGLRCQRGKGVVKGMSKGKIATCRGEGKRQIKISLRRRGKKGKEKREKAKYFSTGGKRGGAWLLCREKGKEKAGRGGGN